MKILPEPFLLTLALGCRARGGVGEGRRRTCKESGEGRGAARNGQWGLARPKLGSTRSAAETPRCLAPPEEGANRDPRRCGLEGQGRLCLWIMGLLLPNVAARCRPPGSEGAVS